MSRGDDVLPNDVFVNFVEDFMAHFGVKFAFDVCIAAVAHKIDGFGKIGMTENTRILCARNE